MVGLIIISPTFFFNSYVSIVALDATMATRKISLGPNELRLLFELEKERKSAFSIDDAKRILGESGPSVKNVLYRLKKKGRIDDLEKGKYLLIPARAGYEGAWAELPLLLISHIVDNYYVGFWSALNFWQMTEQVPRTIFVVTTKRRNDLDYGTSRFEFVTISRKKFFGIEEETVAGRTFNISSREKTIVDCLWYPKYSGGLDEVVKAISIASERLDYPTLWEHSKRLGVNVVMRRLGYILELLGLESKLGQEIAGARFNGFMRLDPIGPRKTKGYSNRWGLVVNRSKEELTSWMGQ